jgi:hypothetical protein
VSSRTPVLRFVRGYFFRSAGTADLIHPSATRGRFASVRRLLCTGQRAKNVAL